MEEDIEMGMTRFIGVKIIHAKPMTLSEYNSNFDKVIPATKGEEGYLVEYEDGYKSWSPKDVFEKAYRRIDNLTFGLALEALKKGNEIARVGWNGKGLVIRLVKKTDELNAHFEIFNTSGTFDTWVASVSDTLAEDWLII